MFAAKISGLACCLGKGSVSWYVGLGFRMNGDLKASLLNRLSGMCPKLTTIAKSATGSSGPCLHQA